MVEGVLRGFLTSRETAARLGSGRGGSMRADGWSRMPLVRMTNLHLEPGEGTLEELLADVDDGVYLETNKSWSIDDKRLDFQFGTQIAWEIKEGSAGCCATRPTPAHAGVLGSLDAVAGPEEWALSARRTAARASRARSRTCRTVLAGALPRRSGRRDAMSVLTFLGRRWRWEAGGHSTTRYGPGEHRAVSGAGVGGGRLAGRDRGRPGT